MATHTPQVPRTAPTEPIHKLTREELLRIVCAPDSQDKMVQDLKHQAALKLSKLI